MGAHLHVLHPFRPLTVGPAGAPRCAAHGASPPWPSGRPPRVAAGGDARPRTSPPQSPTSRALHPAV
eukprot:CAMPEP_0175785362 /NCGR_PEP_ID=MMETSP0097-20121207/79288_1 /TAXON_ID=311494 /ORGANISM="Alexandrium monilatum, Strain CCMP3105" /LENGTH=66 /DNA_ID=CAMNT_0017096269 /DNA_START=40 /DNA_END=236 /DNA_ORIENTATION=-